jgi:hypothetical protein
MLWIWNDDQSKKKNNKTAFLIYEPFSEGRLMKRKLLIQKIIVYHKNFATDATKIPISE